MEIASTDSAKRVIITTSVALQQKASRCCATGDTILLAGELNALFTALEANLGAVLLLDLALFDGDDSHPAIERVFRKGAEQYILVVTPVRASSALLRFFELGARGFCPADLGDEQLRRAVAAVADGELWIGRKLTAELVSRLLLQRVDAHAVSPDQALDAARLTPRESEIASFIARGKCDKAIARDLNISPHTVKNHLSRIFAKLQISDRFQLAMIYHGIQVK